MLDELAVRNLGMLASASIEPGNGLVVITGETGAGKTMLLGALQLLLGLSARTDLVGPEGDETLVEGRFIDDGGEEVVVARRIRKTGRSRAYLDGEMAPLKALEERVGGLVEVVAQHDHLAIGREPELRALLDQLLDEAGRTASDGYQVAWMNLKELESVQSELGGDMRALERERELAGYQSQEISDAGFVPGEDTNLHQAAERLRNADALIDDLTAAHRALGDVSERLGEAVTALRKAVRLDPQLEPLGKEAESVSEVITALLGDVRVAGDGVVHDPEALELTESRLALLGDLRRKYGQTLDDVLAFGAEAEKRETELRGLLKRSGQIEEELAEAGAVVVAAGGELADAQRRAGKVLVGRAISHLKELGFTDPALALDIEVVDPRPAGASRISLRFSSDRRLEPAPVNRVASGGELSRLVLALRLAGGAGEAPVIAFDEIDAGVGGRTALALGKKLAELARGRQVLVVTHLPQVAAFADTHYTVDREGTAATVRHLDEGGQLDELARMLAGLEDSEGGRQHAAELRKAALASLG